MNIGIFIPFMNNFGEKGFYNSQEVGLAKALCKNLRCNVTIIKLVTKKRKIENSKLFNNCNIIYMPAYKLGSNGIVFNLSILKEFNLNKLIMFSDIQIMVKRIRDFCTINNIEFITYIGTIESSSKNKISRILMSYFEKRNIKIYMKNKNNIAKTPYIMKKLKELGVHNAKLGTVGLDFDLLKSDHFKYDKNKVKSEIGFNKNDRIILFIGRMEPQKNPLLALDILRQVNNINSDYKMIMIGNGSLKNSVIDKIYENNLIDKITLLDKVKNEEIWKYYNSSDYFINLNEDEIFGMAILEAMYYRCNVIAVKAPGPNYIISNNVNGILIDDLKVEKFVEEIIKEYSLEMGKKSKKHIISEFTWDKTSKLISNN